MFTRDSVIISHNIKTPLTSISRAVGNILQLTFNAPYNLTVEFKMTNRLELNWKLDGLVDEQRYYCSETPIDINSPSSPKAVLTAGARTYVDTNIEVGKTYYIRISSVKNSIEKFSEEHTVTAQKVDPFEQYVYMYASLLGNYDSTGKILTEVGFNNSFQTGQGGVGNGFYRAGAESYLEFDMLGFFDTTTPWCVEFYARTNGTYVDGVASFASTKDSDYATATLASESWFISRSNNDWAHLFLDTGAIRNTWNHHALTYDGENLRRFLNGSLVGSTLETIGFSQVKNLGILGKKSNALNDHTVNDFQHLRLTKGVPRYTSAFIPPVEF